MSKAKLNEYCQKSGIPLPKYETISLDNNVSFSSTITIKLKQTDTAQSFRSKNNYSSKKQAEICAASVALSTILQDNHNSVN